MALNLIIEGKIQKKLHKTLESFKVSQISILSNQETCKAPFSTPLVIKISSNKPMWKNLA